MFVLVEFYFGLSIENLKKIKLQTSLNVFALGWNKPIFMGISFTWSTAEKNKDTL